MGFTDREPENKPDYSPRKVDFFLAGAGHLIVLALGLIAFSGDAYVPSGGEDAIMVSMVTQAGSQMVSSQEVTEPNHSEEQQEEVTQDAVQLQEENPTQDTVQEEIQEEVVQENPQEDVEQVEEVQENPQEDVEQVEEVQSSDLEFASVSSEGMAGSGAPGPGTYESRVFNAIRRGYRTSVVPERSYRIILTVSPDGSMEIEVVRKSGTSAFDRAVENALATAQIPPMPPGRQNPAVINIEFVGPEQ